MPILLMSSFFTQKTFAANSSTCKIENLGSYVAERADDGEHQHAYQFDFWKCDKKLFGFYYNSMWLVGDPIEPAKRTIFISQIDDSKFNISLLSNEFSGKFADKIVKVILNKSINMDFYPGASERTKIGQLPIFSDFDSWEKWAKKEVELFNKKYCQSPNCSTGK